ncbi:MAG: hypothetical protein RSA86_06855 [Christensenellaceae bacterium]
MPLVLKQNYVSEENVICYNCKNYGVLCFAQGFPELQTCKIFGDIDPELLSAIRTKCEHFEAK